MKALVLSNTGVPMRRLAPAVLLVYCIARALPWGMTTRILRKPLLKTLDPDGTYGSFWEWYLDELFSSRIEKADMMSNFANQCEYHCHLPGQRFHFRAGDAPNWRGRVLIAESDTDVIGPARRKSSEGAVSRCRGKDVP